MGKDKIYLTEEFKDMNLRDLKSNNHYAIFAETGAGKTTFILSHFSKKALKENKNVLYLCNRKAIVNQFCDLYQKSNPNLKIALYQTLEHLDSEEELEKFLEDFDYVVCDEAHYWLSDHFNIRNFISFKAINKLQGIVIFITGTPKYLLALKKYLSKPLIILRNVNRNNNNIRRIYVARSKKFIKELTEVRLRQGKKVIEFSRYPMNLFIKREMYKSYKSAFLVSRTNEIYEISNKEIESEIMIDRDVNNQPISNVSCNWLGCTSAYENGCNFNIEGEVLIVFANYITETSLEQCRSRVRDYKDTVIDIVIYVPRNAELLKERDSCFESIREINQFRKEFKGESDLEIDDVLKLHSIYKKGFVDKLDYSDEYEFNQIHLEALEIQLSQVEEVLQQKNKSSYYLKRLKEQYPNAEIVIGNRTHIFDYDKIIKEFIGENEEAYLDKEQQIKLKEKFVDLKVNLKHSSNKIGFNQMKKILEINNSNYGIENVTKYDKNFKKSINTWHIYLK